MMEKPVFADEIDTVARLLLKIYSVPNIVGPARGAPFCDQANKVEGALFMLELCMVDADDVRVSDPCSGDRNDTGSQRWPSRPGLLELRAALREQTGEPPLDEKIWPSGK
jgi:hypothetical protein